MDEKARRYKMIKYYEEDAFDGVTGDPDSFEDLVKSAKVNTYKNVVSHEDKILVNLLDNNPDVEIRLRNNDLASLDEIAKKAIIKKIQKLLGIKPLLNE